MTPHAESEEFVRVWTWMGGGLLASVETAHVSERPLVLVPGLAMSARYLQPLARALAVHHPVCILELPGCGKSDAPSAVLSMREQADCVSEWLAMRRFNSVHLVGHSMGCQVAAHVAALCPPRVETLTLIGPTTDPAARSRARLFFRLLRDFTHEPPAILANALIDLLRTGIARTWHTSGHMLRDNLLMQLRRVHAPTLLLRGRHDSIAPASWLATAAGRLSLCRARTLPRGSHCVHFSHPRLTAAAIRAWVSAASVPRPEARAQTATR